MSGARSSRSRNSDANELAEFPGQQLPDEEAQIGEHRDPNSQSSIQLETNNDGHDLRNEVDPDESARLWADLKAETGYDSYVDYLEVYEEEYPRENLLKRCLFNALRYAGANTHQTCAVFNLQDGPSSHLSLDLQCSSTSAATIISALRQPSATAGVRILLWEASELRGGNLLGLVLKVHPDFFRVLLARHAGLPVRARDFLWSELIGGFDERGTAPDVVRLGQYLVTITRHYLSANLDAPPVIMIFRLEKPSQPKPEKKAKIKLSRVSSSQEAVPPISHPIELLPPWMQEYVRLLNLGLENRRGQISSITDLLFEPLSPLLQFYVFRFREECDFIRAVYLDFTLPQNNFQYESAIVSRSLRRKGRGKIKGLGELYQLRYVLRRMVEESEDYNYPNQLRILTRSQMPCDTSQGGPSTEIEDQLQHAHLEAHRLETEIRDYLQLQIGELALQESRKSIELSNSQIELSSSQIKEAKGVKIFTILAFVYAPLNLATSIFGMNIEQLNGNGQQVWVFIVTAMVALTITGGSWLVIEQINNIRNWQRRSAEEQYDGSTHFSLAVRLAMIALLYSKGHARWMFKSGAWWRLIIDHRSRFIGLYDNGKGSLTAGELVSKYIRSGTWERGLVSGPAFKSTKRGTFHWTSAPEEDERL